MEYLIALMQTDLRISESDVGALLHLRQSST